MAAVYLRAEDKEGKSCRLFANAQYTFDPELHKRIGGDTMAWIESHEELLTHPKSKRLKRKLNVSIHEVVGILHFFWHWAVKYAEDGDITKFSAEDIADAIQFDGDADKLINALIESGFVDEFEDGQRVIHDWFDYAGKLVLWRRKEAERLKGYRKSKKKDSVHSTNEERTTYEPSTDTVRTPEYSNSNSISNSNKKNIKDSRQKRVYDEQSIAYRSANYLYTSILKHKPDLKKPNLQAWSDDMRKLIEIDGRDPRQIANVINWVITEPFWHSQILSASKLREKWDTLTSKMDSPRVVPMSGYKSKAEKDAEQVSALKQRILSGGVACEDINAARSRIDITSDQNGIPQLQFD
jgi:hypothetical protein